MRARIAPIPVERARVLRQQVLRPHQRVEELVFDGDDGADSLHVGAFVDDRLVAVASVMRDVDEDAPGLETWRVRGMATLEGMRGRGFGGAVLERCLEHVRERDGRLVWCNARTGAIGFYERFGFGRVGVPFDVPVIGPHVRMARRLA